MSVTNETYRVQVTLATVVQAIPIPFYFLEQDDLIVFQTVAGADTLMVLNTNYTLAGEGVESGGTLTTIGGTVGAVWTIARADALTQSEEFIYSGSLAASSIERAYDRLAMQIQRVFSMAKRALRFPITNAEGGELALNDRKGKLPSFNSITGALELIDASSEIASAASAAASAVSAAEAAASAASVGFTIDTDSTLAANSDIRVPSQKAVNTVLNLVQKFKTETGNFTGIIGTEHTITATATATDPTTKTVAGASVAVENGDSYRVRISSGIATIGGVTYAIAGSTVLRKFDSGLWGSVFSASSIAERELDDYIFLSEEGTPESHTPVITQSTLFTTALSSPVVYVPYITNTGAQVTNSNGQGDANIRFGPGTYYSGAGGSNDLAMYGDIKPGGAAQFARWPVIASFTTSAANSIVEVGAYSLDNNNQLMPLIEVEGRLVSSAVKIRTVTGNDWKFTLTFPTAAARKIVLYMPGSFGLVAIRVPTGQSITKAAAPTKTIAFIGDSFCNGAGIGFENGANLFETFALKIGKLLAGNSFLLAGIGGTGFTAGGGTNNYNTRASYVVGKSPDILIVNGSINDGSGAGSLASDIATFMASVSTIPRVIVIGTMIDGQEANHDAVRTATALAGREFVDMRTFMYAPQKPSYFYTDGVHPSAVGHKAIARAVVRKLGLG